MFTARQYVERAAPCRWFEFIDHKCRVLGETKNLRGSQFSSDEGEIITNRVNMQQTAAIQNVCGCNVFLRGLYGLPFFYKTSWWDVGKCVFFQSMWKSHNKQTNKKKRTKQQLNGVTLHIQLYNLKCWDNIVHYYL